MGKQLECLQLKELIWNVAQEEVAARPWAMTMIPTNPRQKLTTNVKPGPWPPQANSHL